MENQKHKYDLANQIAKKTFEKLSDSLPLKLAQKEAKIAKRLAKAKIAPIKKLWRLYELMDELATHTEKFTPCDKGCNCCCTYPVTVSDIEIQIIEDNCGAKRNELIVKQERESFTPCPFLKNGTCSIYDARPFVCRRHVTMTETNEWCQPEVAYKYSFPLLSFTEIDKSYDQIRGQNGKPLLVDIRDAF